MNADRFLALCDIVWRAHILNWFWRPREVRRKIRSDILAEAIPKYFERYLPSAAAIEERPVIKDDANEKIFTLWLQGEDNAPPLVKACFRSVRRHCKQELVVLDENSVLDYITLPQEIIDKYRAGKLRAHILQIFVAWNYFTSMVVFGSIRLALQPRQFQIGLLNKISLFI